MKNLVVLFFCFLFLSCTDSKQERITNLLEKWIDYEFIFPKSSVFTIQTKDTVQLLMVSDYKIVTYVDSTGCTSCKMQLRKWKEFMNAVDSIQGIDITFIYNLSTKKIFDVYSTLREERFVYPICIDEQDSLNILNNLPSEIEYQTFLLDKNNKVLAIGNPVHNPKVKELYMNIIQGKMSAKENSVTQTEIQIKEQTISFGHFNWKKEQKANFTICNVGKHPLVINDVTTSCGCTSVEYSKEPVRPGDSISLQVTYKADNPEHFNKTITVYCNANPSLVNLKIVGDAE